MTEAVVRSYEPGDLDACYEICLRTGDSGRDSTSLHTDPRLLGEVWVGPYLARWPEFAFVVEDEAGVGGYITGAPDTSAHERWAEQKWWPALRERYPRGSFPEGSSGATCVNLIHEPQLMPAEIVGRFPAHLHINQLPRLQGRGFGRLLMAQLFSACESHGVDAIHLGCGPDNPKAIAFYQAVGFEDLMGGFLWGRSTEKAAEPDCPLAADGPSSGTSKVVAETGVGGGVES